MEVKGEGVVYGDAYIQDPSDESAYGDDDNVILQEGAIPMNQINDMYQKRTNLYKTQMSKS